MESFGERLRELRQEKCLSQLALSQKINVGKSIISSWELNQAQPTLANLISLAKFFDVSIDYLAGIED